MSAQHEASRADRQATGQPDAVWKWARFDELRPADVYDFLALRSEVFVVEQGCRFLDADGLDARAWHLLARAGARSPAPPLLAYLRLLDAGVKYREPSIGRVITRASHRGNGLGRALMHEGLARAAIVWPHEAIRISAQQRLEAFYASLGFERAGAPYVEDGIDHIEMLRAAPEANSSRSSLYRERIAS